MTMPFLVPIVSFFVATAMTYCVRGIARRFDVVSIPREDRWNRQTIALMGGVAIYATMLVDWAILGLFNDSMRFVIASSTLLFFAGLVDDFANLKPYQKLVWQVVAVAIFMASGLTLPWTPYLWLNTAITFIWLLGITNAVNLLDNMDGLAAGISAIAGCFLAKLFLDVGQVQEAWMMLSFSTALAGFLVFNWNPATIFMGDCGSMLIGFFLGSMSLLYVSGGRFRSFVPVIAVPILILVIPIFDTAFVSILRKLSGRPVSAGGQDHTSHRLVRFGIPEKRAVQLLYALAFMSGCVGLYITRLPLIQGSVLLLSALIGIVLIGVFIAHVRVYDDALAARDQPVLSFLINVSQKQPAFEVALDVLLVIIAFQTATIYHYPEGTFLAKLMLTAVAIQLAIFLVTGLYREIWRFVSVNSALLVARSVTMSAIALFVVSWWLNSRLSLSMVTFNACLMFLLILGSRVSFRTLRGLVYGSVRNEEREAAFIFGAGDAGELLSRELLQNSRARFEPVGFFDDDALKCGRTIHRLPVYGANRFQEVIAQSDVKHVIVSTDKVSDERVHAMSQLADRCDVRLHRMELDIRDVCEPTHEGPKPSRAHSPVDLRS